jgi:hypothetical protein
MEAENGRRGRTLLVNDGCNARLTGGIRHALGRESGDSAGYACGAWIC